MHSQTTAAGGSSACATPHRGRHGGQLRRGGSTPSDGATDAACGPGLGANWTVTSA